MSLTPLAVHNLGTLDGKFMKPFQMVFSNALRIVFVFSSLNPPRDKTSQKKSLSKESIPLTQKLIPIPY